MWLFNSHQGMNILSVGLEGNLIAGDTRPYKLDYDRLWMILIPYEESEI